MQHRHKEPAVLSYLSSLFGLNKFAVVTVCLVLVVAGSQLGAVFSVLSHLLSLSFGLLNFVLAKKKGSNVC